MSDLSDKLRRLAAPPVIADGFEMAEYYLPLIDALLECVGAAQDSMWINNCRCHESYTGRGMHEPNAFCGEMDQLAAALARLAALAEGAE